MFVYLDVEDDGDEDGGSITMALRYAEAKKAGLEFKCTASFPEE